jgi:hypothetical protein
LTIGSLSLQDRLLSLLKPLSTAERREQDRDQQFSKSLNGLESFSLQEADRLMTDILDDLHVGAEISRETQRALFPG